MTMMMHQKRNTSSMNNLRNYYHYKNNKTYEIMSDERKENSGMLNIVFEVDYKYVPIKGIGQGAYGFVCSFIDSTTNEKVAIKKISNVFDNDVEALRALRELKILGHTRHENVIALKDVMVASSKSNFSDLYLVYELMDTDLGEIIRSSQPLSHDHIKYFTFQLLNGLNYLHSANILHRDLKPKNLLVNANCDLKICDFGLARTNKGQGQSMTDYVVTRWYRAPELLLSCHSYGPSVDVWAVGCILAELLCRKPIFPGKNGKDQIERIVNVVGSQCESDLEFIKCPRVYRFVKSLPYSSGRNRLGLFPGADPMAVDLVWKMLVFNPRKRITVAEALKHPYMSRLYDPEELLPVPIPCDVNMDGGIGSDKIRNFIWNEMLLYHPDRRDRAASFRSRRLRIPFENAKDY